MCLKGEKPHLIAEYSMINLDIWVILENEKHCFIAD